MEARHRAGVPDQRARAAREELEAQPVRVAPGRALGSPDCGAKASASALGGAARRRAPRAGTSQYVARSATVLHTWPAGAIAPVSGSGSSMSVAGVGVHDSALRVRRRRGGTTCGSSRAASRIRVLDGRPTRSGRAAGRRPRRAARSRGWSSGTARSGVERRARPVVGRGQVVEGPPSERSHHGPGRLGLQPARCARAAARIDAVGVADLAEHRPSRGVERRAARRRRSWSTSTAVIVLVIEPIRYCVSVTSPGTSPYAAGPGQLAVADDARRRSTGSRPSACARGQRASAAAGRSRSATASATALIRRRPRAAGRRRPGCGRRTPGRSRATGGQYLSGSTPVGKTADLAGVGAVPLADQRPRRCAGRRAAASSRGSTPPPRPGRSRPRIAIIASQNRSISARSSDSVGSTISVPATGNDIVGAWKP